MTGEMRTCRCVCGGYITAPADDWDAIATEVRLHNATPMHEAWRLGLRLVRREHSYGRDGRGVWTVAL